MAKDVMNPRSIDKAHVTFHQGIHKVPGVLSHFSLLHTNCTKFKRIRESMSAPSQVFFLKGCCFPVMCLPRPRSSYTKMDRNLGHGGPGIWVPKISENRPDGISKACNEFKIWQRAI